MSKSLSFVYFITRTFVITESVKEYVQQPRTQDQRPWERGCMFSSCGRIIQAI